MKFHTPICDLFEIEFPIVLAGMGGASGPLLAAAVSNAGGLGVLGAAACGPAMLDEWIVHTRKLTDRPFGVDTLLPIGVPSSLAATATSLISAEVIEARNRFLAAEGLSAEMDTDHGGVESMRDGLVGDFFAAQIEVVLDHRVPVYVAGLGVPSEDFMRKGRQVGMKFMGVAGQTRHSYKLAMAGVDAVVAQGTDGGGHNSPVGTMALIPQVVDTVAGLPVLGAGGISDGRGVAAAFMLGALGAWVGTRFLATEESLIPMFQKEAIVAAADRDTVVSSSVTGKPARMLRGKWAELFERGEMHALPMPLQTFVSGPVLAAAMAAERGDVWPGFAGQGVGLIHDIPPAAQVLTDLLRESVELLCGLQSLPGVKISM